MSHIPCPMLFGSKSHHARRRSKSGRRLLTLEILEGRTLLSADPTVYTVNLTSAERCRLGRRR